MRTPKLLRLSRPTAAFPLLGSDIPWRSIDATLSGVQPLVSTRIVRPTRLCLVLLVVVVLLGCENPGQPTHAEQRLPWPQAAVVADLSNLPATGSAQTALTDLKAIGFDTVLFDARVTPPDQLQQWITSAQVLELHTAVRIGPPADFPPGKPGDPIALPKHLMSRADGLVVLVGEETDLDYAGRLRAALNDAGYRGALIAQVTAGQSSGGQPQGKPSTDRGFDATLFENASQDLLALLNPAGTPPSEFAAGYQQEARNNPSHWHQIPHCQAREEVHCSEDIRLLVMGLMLSPAPVIGVIEGAYWRDVYSSLIQLRRQHPLIRTGSLDWYAADDAAGVIAYRVSNDRGQTVLVAVNLADRHHELPLPFGFMAVSKITLWASYDPTLRELVTSKPVALPARSAVVVIRN